MSLHTLLTDQRGLEKDRTNLEKVKKLLSERQLRANDSLARLGGDEFAALDSTTTLATTQPMFWTRTAIASNSYTNAGSTKR